MWNYTAETHLQEIFGETMLKESRATNFGKTKTLKYKRWPRHLRNRKDNGIIHSVS